MADDMSPYSLVQRGNLFLIKDNDGNEVIAPDSDMNAVVAKLHAMLGVDPTSPL